MSRFKISLLICLIVLTLPVIAACQTSQESDTQESLQIMTSLSIIADITEEIVGDKGHVDYIVPLGEEPEEYEPVPSDFQKVNDAHVFFVNGFNIESWLGQLVENVSDDTKIVAIAEKGPSIPLANTDIPDPHLWLDPILVRDYYVEEIFHTLEEIDPDNLEYYQERAHEYGLQLEELDKEIKEMVKLVAKENRIIITSENAFKYYGDAYGFETDGIWELNSHEEGTPQQMSRIIDLIDQHEIPTVFYEATLNPQYITVIADEANVNLHGEVHTDAIGAQGSGAENYIQMMETNTKIFVEGLGE